MSLLGSTYILDIHQSIAQLGRQPVRISQELFGDGGFNKQLTKCQSFS